MNEIGNWFKFEKWVVGEFYGAYLSGSSHYDRLLELGYTGETEFIEIQFKDRAGTTIVEYWFEDRVLSCHLKEVDVMAERFDPQPYQEETCSYCKLYNMCPTIHIDSFFDCEDFELDWEKLREVKL